MIEQQQKLRRFGVHASAIQLLALCVAGSFMDAGTTQNAGTLASLLFWACSALLLAWRRDRASDIDLLFLRWGLLPFVLIGTPLPSAGCRMVGMACSGASAKSSNTACGLTALSGCSCLWLAHAFRRAWAGLSVRRQTTSPGVGELEILRIVFHEQTASRDARPVTSSP